jgi:exocyst complex component 3
MEEVNGILERVAPIKDKLTKLRDENHKHRQYAAAMENLKHIFNVPETIEKTHAFIEEGKLLHAHKK